MVNYADGRAETVARSNGVDTAYGYDSAGRLTLSDPIAGAIRPQARGGSCQSACGEILTGGSKAERDLIEAIGEWSTTNALASELGSPWRGGLIDNADDLVTVSRTGTVGFQLRDGAGPGHMVVVSPQASNVFLVLDPWDGTAHLVDDSWIRRWAEAAVFQ